MLRDKTHQASVTACVDGWKLHHWKSTAHSHYLKLGKDLWAKNYRWRYTLVGWSVALTSRNIYCRDLFLEGVLELELVYNLTTLGATTS